MRNVADDAFPRQRVKDLVVRAHGEETLVLDRRRGTVHCLPAEVTRVWGACTGSNALAEIASAAGVDERTAAAAVDQLLLLDLLETRAGFDRRKFLRRSAMVGAGLAAVPVIESVVAPTAAWAQSKPGHLDFEAVCGAGGQMKWIVSFPPNTGWDANTHYLVTVTVANGGPTSMAVLITDASGSGSTDPNGTAIGSPGEFPEPGTPVTVTVDNTVTHDTFTFNEVLTTSNGEGCAAPASQFIGLGPATQGTSSSDTNPGRFVVTFPEGTMAGDLLLLIVSVASNNGVIHPPATWTQFARVPTPDNPRWGLTAYWKRAASGESSVATVANGSTDASGIVAWVAAYRGPTTPNGTIASGASGPGTTGQPATFTPSPDIQTAAPNATAISIVSVRSAATPTSTLSLSNARGFTLDRSVTQNAGNTGNPVARALGLAHEFRPTPGTVPSPTWMQPGPTTGRWAFITVAFA